MVFPIKYQQKNFKKTSTYYQRSALHALFDENELNMTSGSLRYYNKIKTQQNKNKKTQTSPDTRHYYIRLLDTQINSYIRRWFLTK